MVGGDGRGGAIAGAQRGRPSATAACDRRGGGGTETRAGAGELVNASDLIERVLVVDNSPETVATIKRHLERAGHPDLFQP